MLELDGSAGGGQYVRSALALSALSGAGFRMSGVRAARPNSGLKPQHLAAVRAVADVCDADVSGVDVGATEFAFDPRPPQGGDYAVDVGTAGSVTLVFDSVLPLALELDAPLALRVGGGTDVKWAPPMDYYRRVKLPLLRRAGLAATVDATRPGYYPAGGGDATLHLAPCSLSPLPLVDRGELVGARVYSSASMGLADADVAERQAASAVEALADASVPVVERSATYAEADSPGSALVVRLDFERSAASFDALGRRGTPAEAVADEAAGVAKSFLDGAAAVDEYAADQLLVFLALAGGRVRIPAVTEHVETSLDLVDAFGFGVELERDGAGVTLVGR